MNGRSIAGAKALTTSPWLDSLGFGAALLALLAGVLLLQPRADALPIRSAALLLPILLNYPHFLASYRILYSSKETIWRYRSASIYVPLALAAYVVAATVAWTYDPDTVMYDLLTYVASAYLAWHYTGQAWGATVTSAYLSGYKISAEDRTFLRTMLRVLLVWHLSIYHLHHPFFFELLGDASVALVAHQIGVAAGFGAIAAALYGFYRVGRGSERGFPIQMTLPMLSLFAGYCFYSIDVVWGLFALQMGHASQYLMFTMRIEANRRGADAGSAATSMWLYYAVLVAVGWLVFSETTRSALPPMAEFAATAVVFSLLIHHYFLDSCIWKLSNPETRRDLFKHVAVEKFAPAPR